MTSWLDPTASSRADHFHTWLLVGLGILGLTAVSLYLLVDQREQESPIIMRCPEDAALVWQDAPHTARCVTLDDWADADSLARLDALMNRSK